MVILPIIYQTSVKSDVEQAFKTHEILCGELGDPINWPTLTFVVYRGNEEDATEALEK